MRADDWINTELVKKLTNDDHELRMLLRATWEIGYQAGELGMLKQQRENLLHAVRELQARQND